MIIVEGPDGVGKSTLVDRLSQELNLNVWPKVPVEEPRDVKRLVYTSIASAVMGNNPPLIHDRLFFSELVYGIVLRGRCVFSMPEQDYILRVLKTLGCPVIFCTAPSKVIHRNVKRSQQMKGVKKNLREIIEAYRYYQQFALQRRLNVHYFDYTQFKGKHYIHLTHQLNSYLELRKVRTWHS